MKSGCWKNLSSAVCHIKYSHWALSLLSVNRTASRGWPSSLLFLWLIWNGKYWALKWMPPNRRKKKFDLLMSPAGNVKCVFLTGLGQMYQISKFLLKDSLKHCLLYTEKIVWLAFVVAFFKTVIQCLILVTSVLYLRLNFIIFLSLVEDTLGTSEENGIIVDQALEHIQCSTHSAWEPGCL